MNIKSLKGLGKVTLISMLSTVALVGCLDDDDDDDEELATLRVIHGSPDAPAVNVYLDGDQVIESLDFAEGTGYLEIDAGTRSVEVRGILPDGSEASVIGPVDIEFGEDTATDVIAVNSVANIEAVVLSEEEQETPEGVRVRVNHFAADVPEVDVYVTAPDAALDSPLGSFVFKGSLGPVEVPAGDYQIRVTLAGTQTVAFDSGTVALAAGQDLLISAYPNVATGDSPVYLAVQDGDTESVIFDKDAGADLRVIHNSADTPAVDVAVNNFAATLFTNAPFKGVTDYSNVAAATYSVEIAPTGTTNAAIEVDSLTLEQGKTYTAMAVGQLSDASLEAIVLEDMPRAIGTEARVRIVHGSYTAGNVDIFVTAEGASLDSATPAFTDVAFKAETGYVSLAAGTYDVTVTPTGTTTAAIGPATITIENGKIYTAIARDSDGSGLGLILADDFN